MYFQQTCHNGSLQYSPSSGILVPRSLHVNATNVAWAQGLSSYTEGGASLPVGASAVDAILYYCLLPTFRHSCSTTFLTSREGSTGTAIGMAMACYFACEECAQAIQQQQSACLVPPTACLPTVCV